MAESSSRRSVLVLVLALVVLALLLLFWWSGGEEAEQVPRARAPSESHPMPAPEAEEAAIEVEEVVEEPAPGAPPARVAPPVEQQRTAERPSTAAPRYAPLPSDQEVDAESARRRMERFEELVGPEMVEALRNPPKPELTPEQLERLENPRMPSEAAEEFLIRHGERELSPSRQQDITDSLNQPGALSPSELDVLENPPIEPQ